jgi:hypothetical protein
MDLSLYRLIAGFDGDCTVEIECDRPRCLWSLDLPHPYTLKAAVDAATEHDQLHAEMPVVPVADR